MDWVIIGLAVGIVLGLTGSGGGLLSIPLFIHQLHFDIKQATVLSLIVVSLGAFLNWIPQRQHTQIKVALLTFTASLPAAWIAKSWKALMPDEAIGFLLLTIALFSLIKIWKGKNSEDLSNSFIFKDNILKIIFTGLLLGALTTLTGLGGGVLLVPLFLGLLHLSYDQAISTSLFAITLASLGSLGIQWKSMLTYFHWNEFVLLFVGVLGSTFVIKAMVQKIPPSKTLILRKLCFTAIVAWVFYSIVVI